jgi:hypothetical protein
MTAQGRRIRAARLMFGCAVGAFHSPADAWSWLAERGAAPESGFQP